MGAVTYYVAMPFVRNDNGDLAAGEAQEWQTASAAGERGSAHGGDGSRRSRFLAH